MWIGISLRGDDRCLYGEGFVLFLFDIGLDDGEEEDKRKII